MCETLGQLCRIPDLDQVVPNRKKCSDWKDKQDVTEGIPKDVKNQQYERRDFLHLAMMAYRSYVNTMKKYSPSNVVFETPFK